MADLRFHTRKGPFSLEELARIGQCDIAAGSPALEINDVAPLDSAQLGHLSVFHSQRFLSSFKATKASACVVNSANTQDAPKHLALLTSQYPHRSYALIANAFYLPGQASPSIAATAQIDATARIGKGCEIGHFVVIGPNAEIGDNVIIGPHSTIDKGVTIGEGSILEAHVSLTCTLVGKHVHIKPGARIGQGGFGFFMDAGDMGGHVPVPQVGRVIIEDYVEIGANTTIDRGSNQDTIIGKGTRIDNLVQVAHNVRFGKGCVMVAQSGVAGSTKFGDFVAAGGQVGIIDNLDIGTGVRIAAQSGIMSNIEAGSVVCGSPAVPIKDFYRQVAVLHKLADTKRKKKNVG